MSSTPLEQQSPPPPYGGVTQQAYTVHKGQGSVGPVIAVLTVITILGIIAAMIGRLCSARRRIMGHAPSYDCESWVERKCSSCLDGRPDIYPPREAPVVTVPIEDTHQEIKEEKSEERYSS
ncbi:uncharacterized protein LOC108474927 [Gossypium arboreum]|uniref:Uncharacterized protein n=1 Tax=Gossypium arboreum TaxID=29729 RepID=A0ABR0QF43_GOSAR|nr:uncharacterized protein LOC108474927 [Gossypium arboreum]KAK5837925.1 hypothetical protein PVK06_006652 [Gossypium arboreum]